MCASKKIKLFSHTSSRIAAQTVVESFCSSSTSSAKTPLLRFFLYSESSARNQKRDFSGCCAQNIYILGIIDFDFRLLWKQQTTGRSKISSTRSPSRTFSGILLLLPPPLRRRRRNQRRSTIFFSDAFSSCRDVEWTSPFAKKNAPMMMHR